MFSTAGLKPVAFNPLNTAPDPWCAQDNWTVVLLKGLGSWSHAVSELAADLHCGVASVAGSALRAAPLSVQEMLTKYTVDFQSKNPTSDGIHRVVDSYLNV